VKKLTWIFYKVRSRPDLVHHNVVVSVIVPDGNSELDGTRVKNQTSKE